MSTPKITPPTEVKIVLNVPTKIGGVLTDTLTLRRPKVRDRLLAQRQGDSVNNDAVFIANLTMILPAEVEELDCSDFDAIQKQLADMINFRQPS